MRGKCIFRSCDTVEGSVGNLCSFDKVIADVVDVVTVVDVCQLGSCQVVVDFFVDKLQCVLAVQYVSAFAQT